MDKIDEIIIIENFLSELEVENLLEQINNTSEWKEKDSESNVKITKVLDKNLSWSISNRVKKLFKNEYNMQKLDVIHKTDSNSYWEEHSDNSGCEETKLIVYGVIIYINDDYEGGNLVYPNINFSVKPKRGMLVYHPGNYRHYVAKVDLGNRYTLTSFIRDLNKK